MQKNYYEILNYNLETVEDMINALLTVPKNYLLHPLGEKCAIAINHYHKCIQLDNPNWINEYAYELKEDIKQNGNSFIVEVDDDELSTFAFGYVWEGTEDNQGNYSYYTTTNEAKQHFDVSTSTNKTYGMATFVRGKLEPSKVLGTTL